MEEVERSAAGSGGLAEQGVYIQSAEGKVKEVAPLEAHSFARVETGGCLLVRNEEREQLADKLDELRVT